jgi:rSAM/selenodomain-associated transferase 2
VAVIIPALNEAAVLPKTVAHLFSTCTLPSSRGCSEPTVIVVDADSKDDTQGVLAPLVASHPTLHFLTHAFPSRGAQQNFGAQQSDAPVLLFLHADTLLPPGWDATILATLSAGTAPALGTFSLSLPSPIPWSLRLMLWGAHVRAKYGGLPYGDQAYFLRRTTLDAVGGVPDVPIMEDVELLKRISRTGGRVVVLEDRVVTSPRRWIKNGMVWNTVLNQLLVVAWLCGVTPHRIYTWYYGRPPRAGADDVK